MVDSKNNKENSVSKKKQRLLESKTKQAKKNANAGNQSNNIDKKFNESDNKLNNKAMKPNVKRIKVDEPQYPTLVPTSTEKYNWNKQILSDLYLKELTHTIYHLWLDCLYEKNINPDHIYDGIRPVLGEDTNELLPRHIFINVIKTQKYPTGKPAGSCFIILPNKILDKRKGFEAQIVNERIHMSKVHIGLLRDHMKDNHIFVLSKGYAHLLSKLSPKSIEAIYSENQQAKQTQHEPQHHQVDQLEKESQPSLKKDNLKQQRKKEVPNVEQKQEPMIARCGSREESGERDEQCSSPEIIQVITSREKKERAQVKTKTEMEESLYKPEFLPVTEESLETTLKLMNMFEIEKRAVAIVFDPCFLLDNIDMKIIRDKFQPIFGNIEPSQVLIRINSPKLAKNLEEAYKGGIKTLNHAYIIGAHGMNDNDINRKAAARGTFCCPMTLGCIINNLKRGIYLMHRSVLFRQCEYRSKAIPEPMSVSTNNKSISQELEKNNQSPNKDQPKSNSASKRNRFAASMNGEEPKLDESSTASPVTECSLHEIDSDMWNKISKCGNSVIKIENLPAKLSLNSLNLMMGTFSLRSDQIIAANQLDTGGLDLMEVRIVIDGNKPDARSILNKNKSKTAYNRTLIVERTHQGELRKFMRERANKLRKLDNSDILPTNGIGYGNCK